jgi:hypothetical protein
MAKTMLFNPYTGRPRDPRDIQSDPEGILVLDPDEPLRAYAPPAADAVSEAMVEAAARAFWGADIDYMFNPRDAENVRKTLRRAIAAALAARDA